MEVISSAADMRRWSRAHRAAGRRVAFVPTMGFLHEGHLSLVREARARADVVAVSIYVNPAQFAAHEDFGTYPRDDEGDLAKLRAVGADAAFVPAHLYAQDAPTPSPPPPPHETFVTVERLSTGLCSTTRPHFFRGVATVVCKLFNVVEFMMHDKDCSGTIDMEECMEILFRRFGKEQLEAKVNEFFGQDEDGDNEVTFTEFLNVACGGDTEKTAKTPSLMLSQGIVKRSLEENQKLLKMVAKQQEAALKHNASLSATTSPGSRR